MSNCCENKVKFLFGPFDFGHLRRTRALQRSVALGSRGIISVKYFVCCISWQLFKLNLMGREKEEREGRVFVVLEFCLLLDVLEEDINELCSLDIYFFIALSLLSRC